MTTEAPPRLEERTEAVLRTPRAVRRARMLGVLYLALAGFVLWAFGLGTEAGLDASFGLSRATSAIQLPPLELPARALAFSLGTVIAFLGGAQLWRGYGRFTNVVLGVVLVLVMLAFLGWAAAGKSFSLVGMMEATVVASIPITLGALSGVLCERVAVINIAIEGMLLTGAFVGTVVASTLGLWTGLAAAIVSGGVLGWVLAVLAIRYRVDQIIAGVVINIFALGFTSFLTSRILTRNPHLNDAPTFRPIPLPLLSDIPIIGPVLFRHNLLIYATFVLVGVIFYGLFFTRWGLRARAVGEHPKAADTVGIDVYRMRYAGVILGGMVAGLGGAYFTLGSVGRFDEGMTAGRGFIGLAAMIFGRWNPVGAFGAGLVFGFADSLQQKLAILATPIPSEFLLMAPYLATIIVVAGVVGRARPPAADGQPYVKE